jgi:predicted site-specific integrase-resolvase
MLTHTLLEGLATEEQAAAELGVNVRTLYRWRGVGKGPPHLRIGRRIYYRRAAVAKWFEEQEHTGPDRKRGRAA